MEDIREQIQKLDLDLNESQLQYIEKIYRETSGSLDLSPHYYGEPDDNIRTRIIETLYSRYFGKEK